MKQIKSLILYVGKFFHIALKIRKYIQQLYETANKYLRLISLPNWKHQSNLYLKQKPTRFHEKQKYEQNESLLNYSLYVKVRKHRIQA